MKYCPYCGAVLADGAASFCADCGKTLPVRKKEKSSKESAPHLKEKLELSKKKPSKSPKRKKVSPEAKIAPDPECPQLVNDGYDGYYDDIPPADGGKQKEGLDVGLIKKIVAVTGVMLLIVTLCVVAMYLL